MIPHPKKNYFTSRYPHHYDKVQPYNSRENCSGWHEQAVWSCSSNNSSSCSRQMQAGEDAPSLVSSIASQVWDAHAHDLSLTVKRDVNTRPHMSHMYAYLQGFRSFIAVFLSNTLCGFFSFWCTLMSPRVNVPPSYALGHNPNRGECASKH